MGFRYCTEILWTFNFVMNAKPCLGITVYGAAYFFVHDLFIHQRIKVLKNTKNKYLLGIRRGHKVHHKKLTKQDGECFGMLLVPYKYFKLYK